MRRYYWIVESNSVHDVHVAEIPVLEFDFQVGEPLSAAEKSVWSLLLAGWRRAPSLSDGRCDFSDRMTSSGRRRRRRRCIDVAAAGGCRQGPARSGLRRSGLPARAQIVRPARRANRPLSAGILPSVGRSRCRGGTSRYLRMISEPVRSGTWRRQDVDGVGQP